jgi:hypothetical protein
MRELPLFDYLSHAHNRATTGSSQVVIRLGTNTWRRAKQRRVLLPFPQNRHGLWLCAVLAQNDPKQRFDDPIGCPESREAVSPWISDVSNQLGPGECPDQQAETSLGTFSDRILSFR